MPEHEAKQGDWFAKIVKRQGYGNAWKPIYQSADNSDFRKICPEPDLLIPGETCVLPDKNEGEETKATEKKWPFELAPSKAQLHVVILRPNGQPLKSTAYQIVFHGAGVEGQTFKKKTDGSGAVKCDITTDVETATLTIDGQTFELLVGHLEPATTTKGVQARLQNLNYHIQAIDGASGAGTATEAAVKAFQQNYSLSDPAGVAEKATKNRLKTVYGC
jgi:hypothetical protein